MSCGQDCGGWGMCTGHHEGGPMAPRAHSFLTLEIVYPVENGDGNGRLDELLLAMAEEGFHYVWIRDELEPQYKGAWNDNYGPNWREDVTGVGP